MVTCCRGVVPGSGVEPGTVFGSGAEVGLLAVKGGSSTGRRSGCCSTGWSSGRSCRSTRRALSTVRGPKHVVKNGKTPVLSAEEARGLLDGIELSTLAGLRDRALIGVLVFSFARITAAVSMRVSDYYTQGRRSFFRLHEKGGRYNVVPAHRLAQEYVDVYLEAAVLGEDRKGPLFRSCMVDRQDLLEDWAMSRATALRMIERRARQAGLPREACAQNFRGTRITGYLRNGDDLEVAVRIAGHESTRTTQLYDRVQEEISLDEIERIHI